MTDRLRILLTNDDGITAPGLQAAYAELKKIGSVVVVAPDAERSAVGHAITTLTPLRVKEFRRGKELMGWAVNGMPADCVKIGLGSLLDEPPHVVVSGINLGPNTATNVIYSGTVSAATEARILGVPSMAVSLATYAKPDFRYAAVLTRRIAAMVAERGLPDKVLLNVNVPPLPRERIKGLRITRQGSSTFEDDFAIRTDPRGQPYYWLAGSFSHTDEDQSTDAWSVKNGYVSITPIQWDLTAHSHIDELRRWPLRI